jgi:hypothetical protein
MVGIFETGMVVAHRRNTARLHDRRDPTGLESNAALP